MRRFFRFAVMVLGTTAMALLATSCGESKVVQCNKLIDVINKGQSLASSGINGNDPAAMNQLATNLDGLSKEIKGVQVQDAKLQEFQTNFARIYQTLAQSSREIANAVASLRQTQPTGAGAAQAKEIQAKAQSATQIALKTAQEESRFVSDLNGYCEAQ
ncbi:MAG: hypothetical protein KME12_09860 [Trichocoleus desertorum ATA4-8-CV12]|jgi:hypothetical protein|nr:hypothetical protein [Trichocoleus desertorum ATA4-8-CV12]